VAILVVLLLSSLYAWHRGAGAIAVTDLRSRKAEMFLLLTIMLSQTLGTALGDGTADSAGLGYAGGALVFDKPHQQGGLALSRFAASFVIAAFMIACLTWMSTQRAHQRQRAGRRH